MASEFAVRIEFRHGDGRCYISSPDLVGLHLAGSDMAALRDDLEPAIKDLVLHNLHRVIGKLRFIPSLDDIAEQYRNIQSAGDERRTEVCLIEVEAA